MFVRRRRSGEVLAADADATTAARPERSASSPTTTGCSGPPRDGQHRHVITELRSPTGAILATQRVQRGVRAATWRSRARASRRIRRPAIAGRSSAATASCRGRRRCDEAASRAHSAPAWIPCAALHCPPRARARRTRRIVFLLGKGTIATTRARLIARIGTSDAAADGARTRAGDVGSHARRDSGADAGRFVRHADESLAALSGRELPHLDARRLLPAGRRVRLPRSAAGRDGAAVCRAGPRARRICCAPPAASSSKATCSTGGTSRPAAACAPAAPTICSGCRHVVADYVRTTGDTARPRRERAVPAGAAARSRRTRGVRTCRRLAAKRARSSSTACARSSAASRAAPHGLPLIGTGDWNDGMNRVGSRSAAKAPGSGSSFTCVLSEFVAAVRSARRRANAPDATGPRRDVWRRSSS